MYIIYKKAEGVFEIVKDSEVYISDSKWSGTQKDGYFDFKSENGARLYSNVYFNQVQFIDETESGTVETFANAIALHIRLKQVGFFDTSGGSGSGGATTFKMLTDTFSSFVGHDGKTIVIDGNFLVPTLFYNKQFISELNDVSSDVVENLDSGTILQVQTVTDGINTYKKWVAVPFPNESGMLPDGFLSFGSLTRNENEIDISTGYTWRLNGNQYGNLVDYNFVIESAATGDSRVDIIVANPDDTFELIQGQPSAGTGTAIAEATPIGSLFLTSIDIYEDNISDPENPFLGELYVEKKESASFNVFESGDLETIVLSGIQSRVEVIGDQFNGVESIGSMSRNGTNYKEYPGKILNILNDNLNDGDLKIYHDNVNPDNVFIPFFIHGLLAGEFLTVPKGYVAQFYYKNGYFYYNKFVGSGGNTGDFIPLSGTEVGEPVTGDIEIEDAVAIKGIVGGGGYYLGDVDNIALQIPPSGELTDGMTIFSTNLTSKGLLGQIFFDKQDDPLAFAQLQDVTDLIANIPSITIDALPTPSSSNAVSSGGVVTYIDTQLSAVYRAAGDWNASSNTFPTVGTGTAGAVRRGDTYKVTVAGNPFGGPESLDAGDSFYAVVNNPGQTPSNWGKFETNTAQATESFRGTSRIATNVIALAGTDNVDYMTALKTRNLIDSRAFIQGGNSFGTTASVGTMDNNDVAIVRNNTPYMTFQTSDAYMFRANGILHNAGITYSALKFGASNGSTPMLFTRNRNDAVAVFGVDNLNSGSTGNSFEVRNQGTTVASFNKQGQLTIPDAGTDVQAPNLGQVKATIRNRPLQEKTSSYPMLNTDYYLTGLNTITFTAPTAISNSGKEFVIKNVGTGIITIASTALQTFDGSATITLLAKECVTIFSDGVNWQIRSFYKP